jgi:hypothetical protein
VRAPRRPAALLPALVLTGALTACTGGSADQETPIVNDPGASPQDGNPVAPASEGAVVPSTSG